MCFAPYVSLTTFTIEVILSLLFLFWNPKDKLNKIIALISFLLGFYQLNEFLICTTGINVFTKLAMITTAVLPALGISYALIMSRKKINSLWNIPIYLPAFFFILMFALFYYKNSAVCYKVFIFYPSLSLLGKFYSLYYFVYLFAAALIFYFASTTKKSKHEKTLLFLGLLGVFIFTIPTYVFLLFLPALSTQFSSVLCEFALLLDLEFIAVLLYKEKYKIKY